MLRYRLLKTEPDVFSFADLLAAPDWKTLWEGVRNFQARNFLREMQRGERVLIYQNVTLAGDAGVAEAVHESVPDSTQFDAQSPYHDARATPDAPRWDMVAVTAVAALPRFVPLAGLRAQLELQGMKLLQRGSRQSVTPVTAAEFGVIVGLGGLSSLEEAP